MKTKKIENPATEIQIVKIEKKKLSKNQELFNALTKRIAELQKEIVEENNKFENLLVLFSTKLRPLFLENANEQINLAMEVSKKSKEIKFTKKQLKEIKEVINNLCTNAFVFITPNEEQEKFYDEWSDVSYKEEIEIQHEDDKNSLAQFMKNLFDVDIDLNSFEDTPEGFNGFQEKIKEEIEKQGYNNRNNTPKTKKELEKEGKLKEEEDIKNKSIRSIYITLAKLLHPDGETVPELKLEKEEIMKKVTNAYEQKDLTTLLKLEMEWVHKETKHLEKLTDKKLKVYIALLEEQVLELTNEKYSVNLNPRFYELEDFPTQSEKRAKKEILFQAKQQKNMKNELEELISSIKNDTSKNATLALVKQYLETKKMESFMDMEEDFFDLF